MREWGYCGHIYILMLKWGKGQGLRPLAGYRGRAPLKGTGGGGGGRDNAMSSKWTENRIRMIENRVCSGAREREEMAGHG